MLFSSSSLSIFLKFWFYFYYIELHSNFNFWLILFFSWDISYEQIHQTSRAWLQLQKPHNRQFDLAFSLFHRLSFSNNSLTILFFHLILRSFFGFLILPISLTHWLLQLNKKKYRRFLVDNSLDMKKNYLRFLRLVDLFFNKHESISF
jgi:hypothetical protein